MGIKRMLFSRDFLNNSPYKYRLSGINKFEGYIGYIYSNGVVLFEKFYENEKTGRIAKNSATYVMNIYNFLELSKLSRSEIIKSLKDGSITDVYRIFHSENMEKWTQDVSRAITGSDYSNVDLEYITDLINQNTLFDAYRNGEAYNVGISYSIGPVTTGLSYFDSKSNISKNRDKIISFSNSYEYNKNITFSFTTAHLESAGENNNIFNLVIYWKNIKFTLLLYLNMYWVSRKK